MGDGDPTLPASGFRFFFNPIAIFVALYMPKVYVFLCCVVSGTAASTTTAPPVFCVTGEHEATAVTMVPTAMFLSSPAFPIPEAFAFASPVLGEAIGVRPTDAAAVAGDCVTADVTRDIPNVSHEAGPTTTTTERLPNSIDRDTFCGGQARFLNPSPRPTTELPSQSQRERDLRGVTPRLHATRGYPATTRRRSRQPRGCAARLRGFPRNCVRQKN